MGFVAKIFVLILLSSTASAASQTQDLLDKLARAPSAEAAKKIVINIQEAWINSHKDSSEKKLMSQALSSMDNGNLTKAERELTKLIQKNPDYILRTHTSSVQVRYMEKNKETIKILSPGRVFRNESISARSHCIFHQIEGLCINNNTTFSDLKSCIYY